MKIRIIILIIFMFLLVGCQSNIDHSNPDGDSQDDVIDYELLESIHAIKEVLRNNTSVPVNSNHLKLSTKLSSDSQPILFLDEERLQIFNEHYSLLESIVLDGYQSGTDFEAFEYIQEDNQFFYSMYLNSLKINITKRDEGIQSYIIRELLIDSNQYYIVDQVIGEFIDGKLFISRLQTSDGNFFLEEFVESKGMLTLVYEPINGEKIQYENIFLVPYNETTNIVVNYTETIDGIIEIYLLQHIYDELNNLIHRVGTYDSLSYTLHEYAKVESIYAKLINQESNLEDLDSAIATLLVWPQILKWASYENLADYMVLEERIVPVLNFDTINDKIPEEHYSDYLNTYNEYLALMSKDIMSYDDVLRVYEIAYNFYASLRLNQEDFTLVTVLYPVIDLVRLEEELVDDDGFSSSIFYYDDLNPDTQLPNVIEYAIKYNHTYVEANIENMILEYGNHYGIQGRNITSDSFLNYLSSLGFILE